MNARWGVGFTAFFFQNGRIVGMRYYALLPCYTTASAAVAVAADASEMNAFFYRAHIFISRMLTALVLVQHKS
jgi:hypothetical protein